MTNRKKFFFILSVLLVALITLCIIFMQQSSLNNKVYLFQKENSTHLPGNIIYFKNNKLHIIEVVNRDELLQDINNTSENISATETTPESTRTIIQEYDDYQFDKNKNIITAKGLKDSIVLKNNTELSYKGNVYLLEKDISFNELQIK